LSSSGEKRSGSGKPQQNEQLLETSLAKAAWATGGSKLQQLLAPSKQEVARSSRAPPTPNPPEQRELSVSLYALLLAT
jgi:hypothetical protein